MTDDYPFNLGTYTRPASSNPTAQLWFDRGLIWTYAFHHEESAACFRRAISLDPDCLLAYWGLAYALGPNYNKPVEAFDDQERAANFAEAREAVSDAEARLGGREGSLEAGLVRAVGKRYDVEGEDVSGAGFVEGMEEVYKKWPEDLDVAALYADALMNLTPWNLWDLKTGEASPESRALEAKDVLTRAMKQEGGMRHPGILHLFIHLVEMSQKPEEGLPAANALRNLVPDAGHLLHMPTHLDVLCGDYASVMQSNALASAADEKWAARGGVTKNAFFYSLYVCHNYHFRIYGAMFAAQEKVAMETVAGLEASVTEDLLRVTSPSMADYLESFVSLRVHILIRFGRWDEILQLPLPRDKTLYSVTTAMTHYARAIAHANLHHIDDCNTERALFTSAVSRVPASRTLFNNTCQDILAIAAAMLDGELAWKSGDTKTALQHLRHAIHLSDHLPYDEPWGWMQPPRHAYGALLLDLGDAEAAEAVFKADLGLDETLPRALRHPRNVWALHGLWESLERRGRREEAGVVKGELEEARRGADVEVWASCACRGKKWKGEGG